MRAGLLAELSLHDTSVNGDGRGDFGQVSDTARSIALVTHSAEEVAWRVRCLSVHRATACRELRGLTNEHDDGLLVLIDAPEGYLIAPRVDDHHLGDLIESGLIHGLVRRAL